MLGPFAFMGFGLLALYAVAVICQQTIDKIRGDFIVQLDSKDQIAQVISKLCEQTWKDSLTGAGADAVGLNHTGLKINYVYGVNKINLLEQYNNAYNTIYKHQPKEQTIKTQTDLVLQAILDCIDIEMGFDVSATHKAQKLLNLVKLRQGETLLFHGTRAENIEDIVDYGFNLSKCKRGIYGHPRIYLTESSQKADQYTDPPSKRSGQGQKLYLLVVRVALGKTVLFENRKEGKKYDTIVGGTDKRFREFVVTDPTHLYPQFAVEYERVTDANT